MRFGAPGLLFCAAVSLAGAERIDLNGPWRLALTGSAASETVNVPHTWNTGRHAGHQGVARYSREFSNPLAAPAGKRVELHFDATFYRSRVFLNGTEIGGHEGGHTAYWFDITDRLRPGSNVVEVEIDNRPTLRTIPGYAMALRSGDNVWYDWWHYGGIVRDVYLRVTGDTTVRRQQIRSRLQPGSASLTSRVFLENRGARDAEVTVLVQVLDPEGAAVASAERKVAVKPGRSEIDIPVRVPNPRLWHFDHPTVY